MPLLWVQPATGSRYRFPSAYPVVPAEAVTVSAPVGTDDILTAPSADLLGRQTAKLAPRGRAWNTDEAAAPWRSKIQHGIWGLIGEGLAEVYATLTRILNAAFPSRADSGALTDWEDQLGLPDACGGSSDDLAARRRAVQAARIQIDGFSRIDALRLMRRAGAPDAVSITERRSFECGWSECGAAGLEGPDAAHQFYISGIGTPRWLECGASPVNTPLGYLDSDAPLCVIERAKHAHTRAIYEPEV